MGTNYYAVKNRPSVCGIIHIGKSSAGWMFLFQTQNDKWNDPPVAWNSFDEVREWLYKYTVERQDYVIMDEYDEIIPFDDFLALVESKQENYADNPDNFRYGVRNVNGYRFDEHEFC